MRIVFAAQVAAFSDSAPARRFADSLTLAGWQSYVARGGAGIPHRVRVLPSATPVLAERVAFALKSKGMDAYPVTDTAAVQPLVEMVPVASGTQFMTARVRWLVSPNGRSILVVHDPAGVEGEALPNGFIFASERDGFMLQRENIWDVAPSPSWNRLVYSDAFVIRAVDGDSIPLDLWNSTAAAAGMPVDSVRTNAFPVSGMAIAYAYSRPVLVDLEPPTLSDSAGDSISARAPTVQSLYVSGGWRVRWTADGSELVLGDAPIRVQDDSPPRNWISLDPSTLHIRGTVSQSRLAPLDWRLGPTLDLSMPIDLEAGKEIRLEGASISSGGGWIRRDGKIVGPGALLAATRDGRFIAALAPRAVVGEHEHPLEPVVYRVRK